MSEPNGYKSSAAATLLFWLMALLGGASLAAALILPPWMEYRVTRNAYADALRRVEDLEARLTAVNKQIEHIQHDPAYNERLARKEFGIQEPGIETIRLSVPPPEPASQPGGEPAGVEGDPVERLAQVVDEAARRNPLVAAYVLDETRPTVLALSALLLVSAILLLNRGIFLARGGRSAGG
ncbi:MAG: hypothetical protein HRF50_06875 [Phycisphaerae bacterium]